MGGVLLALALSLTHPMAASARVWNVPSEAATVQAGIDSAGPGDKVLVSPGRYRENINLLGKGIVLVSLSGPEATILDGSDSADAVVTCVSGEGRSTVIEGFTITGGVGRLFGQTRSGGGIVCVDAGPTIRGNIVEFNAVMTDNSRGGGLWIGKIGVGTFNALVEDNVFRDNAALRNGGAVNITTSADMRGNTFLRNRTLRGDGGAIYRLIENGRVLIQANTFVENEAADHGGAIYVVNTGQDPAAVQIIQNVIVANQSHTSLAVDCSGGAIWVDGAAIIEENTIAYNRAESPVPPAGGGICIRDAEAGLRVARNLIFRNRECGVVRADILGGIGVVVLTQNLIFGNGLEELGVTRGTGTFEEIQTVELDPQFCFVGRESRGEVAASSPALHQECGVIGAVDVPSCGDEIITATEVLSWGRLKTLWLRYE